MVASEAVPFAKTGGLADVAGALPRALARLGHEVEVVIPRYRGVTAGERVGRHHAQSRRAIARCRRLRRHRRRRADRLHRSARLFRSRRDLRDAGPGLRRQRRALRVPGPRGAASGRRSTGARYDVIHAHDWQAGLVPVILSMASHTAPALARVPVVFTIHNLAYQGVFESRVAAAARSRPLADAHGRHGVLGPHQFSEGRHRLQPSGHDREPALCRGDPDRAVRVRLRRHSPRARRRSWWAS